MKTTHRYHRLSAVMLATMLMTFLLTSCGSTGAGVYTDVKVHNENYEIVENSEVVTVNSQLSLKNAILNQIMDGNENAVIRAEAYTNDMPMSISQVVQEISKQNPIGAYSLSGLTYEYSKIVSYYEITLHFSYRRHASGSLNDIVFISDTESIRAVIAEAMAELSPALVLSIGDYTDVDVESIVREVFRSSTETALCMPVLSVVQYPESGSQRILEISFDYGISQAEGQKLLSAAADDRIQAMVHYSHVESAMSQALRIYYMICRNAERVNAPDVSEPFADSMFGVLERKCGTSFGFARTYCQLLQDQGITCSLVEGHHNGYKCTWCRVEIDGDIFYVDPGEAAYSDNMMNFVIDPLELIDLGYTLG